MVFIPPCVLCLALYLYYLLFSRDARAFTFQKAFSAAPSGRFRYALSAKSGTVLGNSIVDSRYRSRKPLIVTTNLTLDEIRHPQNTAHARIYDRLLEMCVPISCIGVSFRKETAQEKMERLKSLIG